MLSALIRGMDGIYGIFFGEMIPFHDPVDPILHIGADKQVDDVISGAQGIIAAASYDDAGAFPGKRFNDDRLGYIGTVRQRKSVSGDGIGFPRDMVISQKSHQGRFVYFFYAY